MVDVRSVIWIDARGSTRQTILRGSGSLIGPTLTTVMSSLQGFSNADVQRWWEGSDNVLSPSPSTSLYTAVSDYAVLQFGLSSTGEVIYVTLPAPQSGIFMADAETVDASTIGGLISTIEDVLVTPSGSLVDTFLGGVRRARLREYQ